MKIHESLEYQGFVCKIGSLKNRANYKFLVNGSELQHQFSRLMTVGFLKIFNM